MLGRWKNYDELEESLCVDEVVATINALRIKEDRERKFFAAIQGIDLEENVESTGPVEDIVDLQGYAARETGFGIDMGLGYVQVGE